jgi:hypothetical protein
MTENHSPPPRSSARFRYVASASGVVRQWRRASWSDRFLLLEATTLLGFAALAITLLSFRRVGHLAQLPTRGPVPSPQAVLLTVRRVRWAVLACARRVPWRAVCFQQGLAAQIMLRRRGIPSVMFYGARNSRVEGLGAHVWVRVGALDVVGGEVASQFGVLAQFPPATSPDGANTH